METNWKELTDSAKSRSEIYGLLAAVFREEPTPALINELRSPRLSGAFSDIGLDLGDEFYRYPVSDVAETLGLEFSRLFIGPGPHISAHESIFTEVDGGAGGLWGKSTVEVKKFIETTGLDYESDFTGLPDHVSVELEFMQKLAEWEAVKWDQQNSEEAEYCLSVQRMFLEQHILRWLPKFCEEVILQAEEPFYAAMAELSQNYMEFERKNMGNVAVA